MSFYRSKKSCFGKHTVLFYKTQSWYWEPESLFGGLSRKSCFVKHSLGTGDQKVLFWCRLRTELWNVVLDTCW